MKINVDLEIDKQENWELRVQVDSMLLREAQTLYLV